MLDISKSFDENVNNKQDDLKLQHPELFRDEKWDSLKENTESHKSWKYILPILIILFGLCFFELPFINIINVSWEFFEKTIDQRIQNIITIFSAVLVVIGIIINNTVEKSTHSYKLLFKYTYIFQSLYLSIFTIIFLISISYLRYLFISDFWEQFIYRSFILSYYLIVVILIFIIFVFKKILDTTDSEKVEILIINDYENNIKKLYRNYLLKNEKGDKIINEVLYYKDKINLRIKDSINSNNNDSLKRILAMIDKLNIFVESNF